MIAPEPIQRINPNLLDNWYFAQDGGLPVNQRGETSKSTNGYFIDRWIAYPGGTPIVSTADGISFSNDGTKACFLNQVIPEGRLKTGVEVTFSILYSNGVLETGTTVLTEKTGNQYFLISNFIHVYIASMTVANPTLAIYHMYGGDFTAKAVKLEYGDTQTLAYKDGDTWVLNDPPPDYQQELEKCLAHQFVLTDGMMAGFGNARTASLISLNVPLPHILRIAPKVVINGGTINLRNGNDVIACTSATANVNITKGAICLINCDVAGAKVGESYEAYISKTIVLDANL